MSEPAPYESVQRYGCPMMDDTPWAQAESGEHFTSPDGIGTAASWLPCVSPQAGPVLPGTCVDCELFAAGLTEVEVSPSRSCP